MAFIRVQKLVRDSNGNILSGSAAIKERSTSRMEVSSIPGRLCANVSGKPSAWLRTANPEYSFPPPPAEGLCPIIQSPIVLTRSAAMTNACQTEALMFFPGTEIHTIFRDAHLLFCFLVKSGIAEVLKAAFHDEIERERVLCHILHGILCDGSRISCDNFIEKSFAPSRRY